MAIPKRIFYVWGADESKKRDIDLCILTWREKLPDYEIIEINEKSIEYFNFQEELKNNKWFRTVYENKLYAYIADYVRIKVLYNNGGIYFDTDVSVVKNIDILLSNPAFVGIQNDSKTNPVVLEPAILGSEKNNPIIKKILDFYEKEIWDQPIYTMPQIFQYILEKEYGKFDVPTKNKQEIIKFFDITIYPERFLIPMRFGEAFNFNCIEADTLTIHWFGGSWVKPNVREFLDNKHKENLEKLLKRCFSKKTIINNPFLRIEKTFSFFNINLDLSYIFRFKHKYYGRKRFLTIIIFGIQIPIWRTN